MKYYQVDAFTQTLFKGNPAGVCIVTGEWPMDSILQDIAMENCLPETAFVLKDDAGYHIRWFAPKSEIYLCGHATLASAFAIFNYEGETSSVIDFDAHLGRLSVRKDGDLLTLDFPLCELIPIEFSDEYDKCMGSRPIKAFRANADVMLVYSSEDEIGNAKVDLSSIAALPDVEGIIATAPGKEYDFVSRVFAPQVGIDEDPVTGSAHTAFCAYWKDELGKTEFTAKQLSERGGILKCKVEEDRVLISGYATLYMVGEINI